MEERRVGIHKAFLPETNGLIRNDSLAAKHPDTRFDFGKRPAKIGDDFSAGNAILPDLSVHAVLHRNAGNPAGFGMEGIVADLLRNVEEQQQTRCQPDGQPNDGDERERSVAQQRTESDGQVVPDHVNALNVEVFSDDFTIEQVHDAVRETGVVRRVRYHDDGRSFVVELVEQFHYFFAVG